MYRSMRLVIAAAAIVSLTCFFARENANALTQDELLQSCQSVTDADSRPTGGTIDIPATGLPCWYYMSALQNMAVLVDQHGARLLGLCPPPDSTVLDFVRAYVKYARKRASGGENAAAEALPGLARAFPCR
jgi:hypothetical protein